MFVEGHKSQTKAKYFPPATGKGRPVSGFGLVGIILAIIHVGASNMISVT
jgi:hypothetical protein